MSEPSGVVVRTDWSATVDCYLDVDYLNSLALDQHDSEHGVVETHARVMRDCDMLVFEFTLVDDLVKGC
jgi:hypothetical protein